jgi:hypothetical protein
MGLFLKILIYTLAHIGWYFVEELITFFIFIKIHMHAETVIFKNGYYQ